MDIAIPENKKDYAGSSYYYYYYYFVLLLLSLSTQAFSPWYFC
jgi:hypothetical protein